MGMTLAQLRAAVILNTQRSDKAALIDRAINFALDEITQRHSFRGIRVEETVEISIGDTEIVIPSAIHRLAEVRVTNSDGTLGYNLELLPKKTFVELYPDMGASASGRPARGFEENGRIRFIPAASEVYTAIITGDVLAGGLESDTDATGIPGIDPCVIAYATSYIFRSIQQHEDSMFWEADYEKRLVHLIRADNKRAATTRQFQQFPPVRPGPVSNPWEDPFSHAPER